MARQPELPLFDLNVEEILENWEVHHAVREIIANALDEQFLSKTREPEIRKDREGWHLRDFGRGVRIEHFTQKENAEKMAAPTGIIGKFGVGLKDALATFHRRGVRATIRSRHGTFRVRTASKHGFRGISTLHVEHDDTQIDMDGTDVLLQGIKDGDVAAARALFLRYASEEVLEPTPLGDILARRVGGARVYINGVFASEEPNFLFTYNVTQLTPAMRKRLNRERVNVGRTTYTERLIAMLKQAKSKAVAQALATEASKAKGDQRDELQWAEVGVLALTHLAQHQRVTFVTERELEEHPHVVDNMHRDGYRVVVIGEGQATRLQQQAAAGGPQVKTFDVYLKEYNDSFRYEFVDPAQLTAAERRVFELTPTLLGLVGIRSSRTPKVLVSETIREGLFDTGGVWDPLERAIVIKRSQLASAHTYAATLLHEAAHATSGTPDVSREFEEVLSTYLGDTGIAALRASRGHSSRAALSRGYRRRLDS